MTTTAFGSFGREEMAVAEELIVAEAAVTLCVSRLDVEQVDVLVEDRRRQLLERRDIDDISAPPVGRDDEVVLARVDDQVGDLDRGHARLERQPALPAVERDIDAPLGPDEQEVGVLPVLDDDVDGLPGRQVRRRSTSRSRRSRSSCGSRPVIVEAPARLGHEGRARRVRRREDAARPRSWPARRPRRASPSGRARSPRRPWSPGPCRRRSPPR